MTQRVFTIVLAILVVTAPAGLVAEEQEETKSSAESYRIGQLDAEEEHGTGGRLTDTGGALTHPGRLRGKRRLSQTGGQLLQIVAFSVF